MEVRPPSMHDEQEETSGMDATLDSLTAELLARRKSAEEFRRTGGYDDQWESYEAAYEGMDSSLRNEKSTSINGPVYLDAGANLLGGEGENQIAPHVYLRLTAKYVDAATAKMQDVLLPQNDRFFAIRPTALPGDFNDPELRRAIVETVKDEQGQPLMDASGHEVTAPLMRDVRAGEQAMDVTPAGQAVPRPETATHPGMEGGQGSTPLTEYDLLEEDMRAQAAKAEKAERKIADWFEHSSAMVELRRCIFDSAKLGVGVIKGPVARMRSVTRVENGVAVTEEKYMPSMERIDPHDFFPDPSCGENIQKGDWAFERYRLSIKDVRDLLRDPAYIAERVIHALRMGPQVSQGTTQEPAHIESHNISPDRQAYVGWNYYGNIPTSQFQSFLGPEAESANQQHTVHDDIDVVAVCVTMIGDTIVKVCQSTVHEGRLPFSTFPWTLRAGSWIGIGVAEQIKVPQAMLNGGTNSLITNTALSSGPQMLVSQRAITPADESWQITPNKIWLETGESYGDGNPRHFMETHQIPSQTQNILAYLEYCFRLAEESTNIPLITQGQSGTTQHKTLGGLTLQDNNANQLLRSVSRNFDDFMMRPLVQRFYGEILLDDELPEDLKGDWQVVVLGSTLLVERAIQQNAILSMAGLVERPDFGLDPKKYIKELLLSLKFDPAKFMRSEAEQARVEQAAAEAPPDSAIMVAQLKAEVEQMKAQAQQELEMAKLAGQKEIAAMDHEAHYQLELIRYANTHQMTVEQVKAKLAETSMKLRVQERLAMTRQNAEAPQVTSPPTEPPGRAPDGEAYQR